MNLYFETSVRLKPNTPLKALMRALCGMSLGFLLYLPRDSFCSASTSLMTGEDMEMTTIVISGVSVYIHDVVEERMQDAERKRLSDAEWIMTHK